MTDQTPIDRAALDLAAELFELRIKGSMARMFSLRRETPDADQLGLLRGEKELTIRGLAETAYRLGFFVEVTVLPVEELEDRPEAEPAD